MAHVSHRLHGSIEGALAGGGDPATSPLYVFGPCLRLLAASGAAVVCFGASIWMVVATVAVVGMMYRHVMRWIPDGSGGSGLCEEELGPWAVKINAAITAIEYTLTWLVSVAALVTFIADRTGGLGRSERVGLAILFTVGIGVIVNRGPRLAARVFGPATAAVLLLLWILVGAVVVQRGIELPVLSRDAFTADNVGDTLGGYVRLLALMTGIEVFANLVAAYEGSAETRARKAFGSLAIVMVTTLVTMVIVGPAIQDLADPLRSDVSVFTQTMDQLLPAPLAYAGTIIGIVVLLSAAAASAQGLQNLALGLRHRHYVPARFGQRNRYDVADRPVIAQAIVVMVCFVAFGTHEETYLALYAAGVFVLLGLTGWASVKRLWTIRRDDPHWLTLAGTILAASVTSVAAMLIFVERFLDGAWTYLVLVPVLYAAFTRYRLRLGVPTRIDERLGRVLAEQKTFLPVAGPEWPQSVVAVVDGSPSTEPALLAQAALAAELSIPQHVCCIEAPGIDAYLRAIVRVFDLQTAPCSLSRSIDALAVARTLGADLVVVTRELDGVRELCRSAHLPVLVVSGTAPAGTRYPQGARIIVGLDGSAEAEATLAHVQHFLRLGARLTLVAVPDGDSAATLRAYVDRVSSNLRELGHVEAEVTGSGPARTLIELAKTTNADLVIVASHGRGGIERALEVPLGSVPERLISELACSLLIVPAGELPPDLAPASRAVSISGRRRV